MSRNATPEDVLAGRARWCVVEADCRDVLPALPDDSCAHLISDPPYDERTHAGARTLWGTGARWRNEKQRQRAKKIEIDFEPLADMGFVQQALRVTRGWVLAFCALEQLAAYQRAAGEHYLRGMIWHRPDGAPQLSGDRPAQAAEGIATMFAGTKPSWNAHGKRGIYTHGVEREERHHPTAKPLPLMMELISDFTNSNDVVLDPFCGSATTGVACLRLGRRFIGIEQSQTHFETAIGRMCAEERGLSLRDVRSGQASLFDLDEQGNRA